MKPKITDALLDELLKNYSQPSDLLGPYGLLTELKKRLINRVIDSELTTHLGYDKHQGSPANPSGGPPNASNVHSSKLIFLKDSLAKPHLRNLTSPPTKRMLGWRNW